MMRTAKLWLATAGALLIAALAIAEALAGEPGLKPPPAAQPQAAEPTFYLMPAQAVARVAEVIEAMRREIERLQAIVDKGSCS